MTRWYAEKKREHFYREAKRVGYRARSAFKLKHIQRKFEVIKDGDIVVDLGAAPGGWSQVAVDLVGAHGRVIGVDLLPIQPLPDAQFIQGDITTSETVQQLKHLLKDTKADVVLSDMSPDISGTYSLDQARSVWLSERALDVAKAVLKPRGNFVCKLFEGADTHDFVETVNQSFYIVKRFSPSASRKASSEIYIIAKSFKNR